MTCRNTLLFSAAAVLLSGCATFYAQQPDVGQQIELWTQEHQYDKALDTIAALSPDHPDYNRLTNSVAAIEKSRQKYVRSVIAEANTHAKVQDWVKAEETLERALELIPDSPELAEHLAYFQAKRFDRIQKDQAAILLAQAYYIISARPHQESLLYNSSSRYQAQQEFSQFLQQAQLASRELYALGQRYWQEEKAVQAREALSLSVKTAPNELSEQLLAEVLQYEQQKRSKERSVQRKQASDQLPELESIFHERLSFDDFAGAQAVLTEMKALSTESNLNPLQGILDTRKRAKIEQLNERGNTLYNSGFLEEAVGQWQQALILDPDNAQIQQQLERAQKFLSNLERWQDESQTQP